jgi:hypothetical protein
MDQKQNLYFHVAFLSGRNTALRFVGIAVRAASMTILFDAEFFPIKQTRSSVKYFLMICEFCGVTTVDCLGSVSWLRPWNLWAVCKSRLNFAACVIAFLLNGVLLFGSAAAQTPMGLEGRALVEALRKGGYNLYFRHAATDVYPQEAEAIVFRPAGNDTWTFVARITPQDWVRLAAEYSDL